MELYLTDSCLSDAKNIEAESIVGGFVDDLVGEGVESDVAIWRRLSQRPLVAINVNVCHPGTQNLKSAKLLIENKKRTLFVDARFSQVCQASAVLGTQSLFHSSRKKELIRAD